MPPDPHPLPGVEGRTDGLAQDDVRDDPQPGLSAVIMTALTPYASAASCVGACRNRNPGTTAERTLVKPVSSSNRNISPSRRAPPIQLAQSFGSLMIDWESCLAHTMSVIEIRPPGLNTRYISSTTRLF